MCQQRFSTIFTFARTRIEIEDLLVSDPWCCLVSTFKFPCSVNSIQHKIVMILDWHSFNQQQPPFLSIFFRYQTAFATFDGHSSLSSFSSFLSLSNCFFWNHYQFSSTVSFFYLFLVLVIMCLFVSEIW